MIVNLAISGKVPWGQPDDRVLLVHLAAGELVGGLVTRISSCTPGRDLDRPGIDRAGVSRDPDGRAGMPGIGCGVRPIWRMVSSTRSIWAGVD